MSEEEKKAIDILINEVADVVIGEYCTHCKICENENMECRYIKAIDTIYSLTKKQQKEIEEKNCLIDVLQHRIEELLDNKKEINYIKPIDIKVHNYISEDEIREKIKELEEQKEKLKYDGNRCFADYEQFCKNLKFFKEQIEELL